MPPPAMPTAARQNPGIATQRRAVRRLPVRTNSRSESQPPTALVMAAKNNKIPDKELATIRLAPCACFQKEGVQKRKNVKAKT